MHKGTKHTEKAKMKNALMHFGKIPWNKGQKLHYEVWNKGKKGVQDFSYRKGKHLSKDTRQKISHTLMGKFINEKNPFWGKKHSKETKQKMSLKKLGKSSPKKGTIVSEITRKRLRESLKKFYRNGGRPHNKVGNGIAPLRKRIRELSEYWEWRKSVFIKDNYTCQICNKRGEKLCVDHYPKTFAQIIRENNINSIEKAIECETFWDMNNGRTLCISCHELTPTYGIKNYYLLKSQ